MRRAALLAFAFVGTATYAASFAMLAPEQRPEWLLPLAIGVAIASTLSWPILGALLKAASPDRRTLLGWFDACLVTIAFGEIPLLLAAGWNLIASFASPSPGALLGAHLGLLAGSDILMGVHFARRAPALGMPARRAALLWVVVMNGVFGLLLLALARPLGYWA